MRVFIQFENKPLYFAEPQTVISCADSRDLESCFRQMEQALARGFYLAGFLSYEAGYYFERCLREHKHYDFPLLSFGVYSAPQGALSTNPPQKKNRPFQPGQLRELRLNISPDRYAKHIAAIRNAIAQGDVYQVTYCLKLLFRFDGEPEALYHQLFREQPVPYPAYVEAEPFSLLSLSPELFIKKTADRVVTKPMKGTWPRGANVLSDSWARWRFQYDSKNRAENVMIADLLRNDLGRIGTRIAAPRLFEVTKYRTLYQMTSTVTGKVAADIPLYDLLAALFPSGSVTGAPKISAMKIIQSLEGEPRRIYTGAIGYIAPNRDLFFNIPIRTLLLQEGKGEMGIGGGIVWDSTAFGEWQEGLLKAKFITDLAESALSSRLER